SLKGKKFIVQGFGNVGYWAAHFLEGQGAILVGTQDAFGSISSDKGIAVADLFTYSRANKGSILGFPGASVIKNEDFFGLDCDICIPAALGNQITKANANSIKATLLAEGANGPTDVEGEKILLERGITIIPDIMCNSGGVIGSYFEWLQNRNGELWQMDEILEKIEKKLRSTFKKVTDYAEENDMDMRSAA